MQAQELRIGNWVMDNYTDGEPELAKVTGITRVNPGNKINGFTSDFVSLSNGSTSIFSDGDDLVLIQPIILTPEILEKCGFEKKGNIYIHPSTMNFDIYNRAKLDGVYYWIAGRMQKDYFLGVSNRIEYLHQLQNLYWSLCGEELDVKL